MLVRMIPEQISRHWEVISYAIENSLPPTAGRSKDRMNRILTALLSGSKQCWVSSRYENGVGIMEAILTTQILKDFDEGTRNLLIYSLYGYEQISKESWISGFDALSKWARVNNCDKIIAYSNVRSVIEVVNSFGGDTSFSFISIPL